MADTSGSSPLVVVALRHADARARVDPLTGWITADPHGAGASEADRCALEHGLRLAERLHGRCAAVTFASAAATEMLREASACGADTVLRVEAAEHGDGEPDPRLPDSGARTARALVRAIRVELGEPALVLTGDHSPDRGTGSTPAFLAAELGAAQALGLVELTYSDTGGLLATRRLDRGRRERLAVPLPAVCSVEPAGVRLRRASLPATLRSRGEEVPFVTDRSADANGGTSVLRARPYRPRAKVLPAPDGDDPRRRLRLLTGTGEQREPPRVVTTDDPGQAADELLTFLRANGYVP